MTALLAFCALVLPGAAAFQGAAYRGLYWGGAIVFGFLGWLAVESTPNRLEYARIVAGNDSAARAGGEFLIAYGSDIGMVCFAAALGLALGGAIYRTPTPPVVPRRPCPFCAEPILSAAVVCKHCGRDVRTAAEP